MKTSVRTMHTKKYTILFTVLMYCSFVMVGQHSTILAEELKSTLNTYYKNKEFNGTVLVAKKGTILYQGAFGYANIEKNINNTTNTKFLIGSATKSFTAIAIMQAREKGLVELHTPIKKYIPELNDELGKLTLHFLMKNSSGLPVHLNRITQLEHRDISSKELIKLYNTTKLAFKPGSKYEYSNLNYQLCAIVLERVTGMPYKDYMETHIFKPLNMHNSGIERTNKVAKDKALGYDLNNGKFVKSDDNFMSYAKGGGDIYANALDLLKWDSALYSNTLVNDKSKQLLYDGSPNAFGTYGYGFKVKTYNRSSSKKITGKLVRHGGSMYGYICNIHRYLDDEVLIVVLGNMRPYPTMEITLTVENTLRNYNVL
ncbi:serine hydrolase domain-containing protein [Pontimicrobium aquaticum]|uniref:Beta-lactamase family protein n=1 Tax=Pontimicrobium aquaticum TaxID=2565367 RepID=A0A4U0EWF8_9FLAO|nr:serine hydrolase domain-containing protein [Pontimicrobium aquaticum]TJY36255.1 beta-lactamase family protein [Pontimicrobium aquaticum]